MKQLTGEELYKHNQKKSKLLKRLAPVCFWGFWALAILCLIFALKNSFGNIAEIMDLLDNGKYTGEQLEINYAYLIQKYGEMSIGNGGSGFQVQFVNVGKALFSGLMVINLIGFVIFIVSAYIIGKWLLPMLSEKIKEDNQDMVNLSVLKNQ